MKKVYILAPIILTLVFGFFYSGFTKEYDLAALAKIEQAKELRHQEQLQEAAERKKAIEAALALNAERKAAREAKEAEDLAEKEARQAAIDERDTANRDQNKFEKQVRDLEKTIAEVKSEIEEVEAEKVLLIAEEKHLQTFVVEANANVKSLQDVLQQIKDAEAAAKAAEMAAAAAAASAKK